MTKPKVDELVEELQADGEIVSPGRFSVDGRVAREKLQRFQLAEPWGWPLELVRAAVRRGATQVDLRVETRRLRLSFDGPAFTRDQLARLYDALFAPPDDEDARAQRSLAVGLNALEALAPERYELRSGDGERGVVLRYERGEEAQVERIEGAPRGTQLEVRYGGDPDDGGEPLERAPGAERTRLLVRQRCGHAPIPVTLDGRRVSAGLTLPSATVHVDLDAPGLSGVCGVVPGQRGAVIRFVVDGVVADEPALSTAPSGVVVVVTGPAFRLDLTQSHVVRDPAFQAAVDAGDAAADRAVALLSGSHLEASWYTAEGGYRRTFGPESEAEQRAALPALYLSRAASAGVRAFHALGRILRPLVIAMYLSPLLLVPKLVLYLLGRPEGDYLIVGFCALAVTFFTLLSVLALLYVVVGPRSRRAAHLELHLDGSLEDALRAARLGTVPVASPQALDRALGGKRPGGALRVRGRVGRYSAAEGSDPAVLRDAWHKGDPEVCRVLSGRPFALFCGEQLLVVDPRGQPLLVGDYQPGFAPPAPDPDSRTRAEGWLPKASWRDLVENGPGLRLDVGDEVELVAPPSAVSPAICSALPDAYGEVARAAVKQRGGSLPVRCLVLRGRPEEPLICIPRPAEDDA